MARKDRRRKEKNQLNTWRLCVFARKLILQKLDILHHAINLHLQNIMTGF